MEGVGQSVDLEKRISRYRTLLCEGQPRLYTSLLKYSFSEHIFEVVEECDVDQLNIRERHWQDFYDVLSEGGLNCRLTGTEDLSGHRSRESVEKQAAQIRGKKHSEETRRRMSETKKGVKRSEDVGRAISEANTGRKNSEESKERMRGKRGPHKNPGRRGQRGPYKKKEKKIE